VDLPAVMVTGGPMLSGSTGHGRRLGTAVWRFEEDLLSGRMTQEECAFAEAAWPGPTALHDDGHGVHHGVDAEALGMQLPYSATWPAVDARRFETAQRAAR